MVYESLIRDHVMHRHKQHNDGVWGSRPGGAGNHHRNLATNSHHRRRQHRSCDQCRKGKRACDAATDNITRENRPTFEWLPGLYTAVSKDPSEDLVGPCSNCEKWNKKCTFEWLRSVTVERRKYRKPEIRTSPHKNRKLPIVSETHDEAGVAYGQSPYSSSTTSSFDTLYVDENIPQWCLSDLYLPSAGELAQPLSQSTNGLWEQTNPGSLFLNSNQMQFTGAIRHPNHNQGYHLGLGSSHESVITTVDHDTSLLSSKDCDTHQVIFNSPIFNSPDRDEHLTEEHTPYLTSSARRSDTDLSNTSEWLAERHTNSMINRDLLRIYHDSMENALSCWLMERNCPYSQVFSNIKRQPKGGLQTIKVDEWGPNWSNRICARVCQLDRSYSSVRGRALTAAEGRAASQALHTAIMAFSLQWTSPERRNAPSDLRAGVLTDATYDGGITSPSNSRPSPAQLTMRARYWNKAYAALQKCRGIESFRIVFACIVLALTTPPLDGNHESGYSSRNQSPVAEMDESENSSPSITSKSRDYLDCASGLAKFNRLYAADEAPLILERGVRQMFHSRYELTSWQRRKGMPLRGCGDTTDRDHESTLLQSSVEYERDLMSTSDYETFNLLFWLSVMFDTASAALYQRPLVVPDEDSNITLEVAQCPTEYVIDLDGWNIPSTETLKRSSFDLWGELLLRQQTIARWPFSFDEAAETLSDSAPVKLLLFRRVTYLQTVLYRKASPEKLEEGIQKTLQLYQFWNQTYGRFMKDCIAHHDRLPSRIQSWYLLIAGHWHLAAILFSDLVDHIDSANLGSERNRELRRSVNLVSVLRRENALAISELASCSLYGQDPSFARAKEFHDAVKARAFLTEPWGNLLIHAFARAGFILADAVVSPGQEYGMENVFRQRCLLCIEALSWLGKISDIASCAADILSELSLHSSPNPHVR